MLKFICYHKRKKIGFIQMIFKQQLIEENLALKKYWSKFLLFNLTI
jgi:hypothetical protein